MKIKYTVPLAAAIVVCILLIAYGYSAGIFPSKVVSPPSSTSSPSASTAELRVFAAASLAYAVQNASQAFEQANNCKIIVNTGGSNSLYQQIIAGSPCDVFLSADFKWTRELNNSSLLYKNSYQNFTTNSIIVIITKDNPKNLTSLLDLTKPGVRIVLAAPSVPAGSYANATLTKIDRTWGNPSSPQYRGPEWENYYVKVAANVVSYENSVEDVVSKVSLGLGTADAGFAFVSDATLQGSKLVYVQIPSEVNTKGIYGIAVMAETGNLDLASKYMNYWLSSEGQNLLRTFGFGA